MLTSKITVSYFIANAIVLNIYLLLFTFATAKTEYIWVTIVLAIFSSLNIFASFMAICLTRRDYLRAKE